MIIKVALADKRIEVRAVGLPARAEIELGGIVVTLDESEVDVLVAAAQLAKSLIRKEMQVP